MESVLNPGFPHITEKIFKCLSVNSIWNCRLLNHEIKNSVEDWMLDENNYGFYLRKILASANAEKLLQMLQIINQEHLWSNEVKEHLILCMMILTTYMKNKFRFESGKGPLLMALDLASRFSEPTLIEIIIQPKNSSQLMIPNEDLFLLKLVYLYLSNKNELEKYLNQKHRQYNKIYSVHLAVQLKNEALLQMLFQVFIEAEQSKNHDPESLDQMIYFLNCPFLHINYHLPVGDLFGEVVRRSCGTTPLYLAAKNGNVKLVKVFVEHIKYIDNINFHNNQQNKKTKKSQSIEGVLGPTAIEEAARQRHDEIVNLLQPFTTDLEYQIPSSISSVDIEEYIQNKIDKFVSLVTDMDEIVARSFLSKQNWNLSAAIKSHSESIFKDDPALLLDLTKNFRKINNVDEEVARSYVLQNNTRNLESVCHEFNTYRSFLYNCKPESFLKSIPLTKVSNVSNEENIKQFVEITKTDESVAKSYLSKHNWECDAALESFYKDRFDFKDFQNALLYGNQSCNRASPKMYEIDDDMVYDDADYSEEQVEEEDDD